jgi:predicted lipid-binding transport protein (Tim44 family)
VAFHKRPVLARRRRAARRPSRRSRTLGPVLGGAFAGQDTLLGVDGWRRIFSVNEPIGLLALALKTTQIETAVL